MADLIGIGFMKSGDPFIFAQHRPVEALDDFSPAPDSFWSVFRRDEVVFVFIEHRNFHFALVSQGCKRPNRVCNIHKQKNVFTVMAI